MSDRFQIIKQDELEKALSKISEWSLKDNGLYREFKFKNFVEALAFITKIGIYAEKLNHHPEIFNAYNKVIISGLCTHDADNAITTLDIELAQQISKLKE